MAIDLDPPLFDASCFDSLEVHVSAENTVTRTKTPHIPPCQLCELQSDQLVFEMPIKSCSAGHRLLVHFTVKIPRATEFFKISITAKVDEIEGLGDVVERVKVTPLQYGEAEWQKFLSLFVSRQDDINDFLKAARGY